MRLSRQTNYSVRTLVYCAANAPALSHVPEIARALGVSDMFLFKIILPVAKRGLLETVRGRNGGIRLARPAHEIKLADVIRLTEDDFAMAQCFTEDRETCPYRERCGYTTVLGKALHAFFDVLSEYTIADLLEQTDVLKVIEAQR